jgi:transcriptional regulator with XRE-family HTH domain
MNLTLPLEKLRDHLERNAGEMGVKIFQTSTARLKIGANPSIDQIKKLTKEIDKNLVLFFGSIKTKEIIDRLEDEDCKTQALLESELEHALELIFMKKGIPGESDIEEITKYIFSKGYYGDMNYSIEMLKQLSKQKVLLALNDNIIRGDVRRFLDRYQSYTQEDIEKFVDYLRSKKLEVDSETVLDLIEKERLCLKFEDKIKVETWQEKTSREYISLFNSPKSGDYKYLMLDEELTCQLLKKISK